MKLGLEKYVYLDSYIHRWQCRPKLIALISFIFSFTLIEKLSFLPLIITITIILYLLSKLPLSFLISRLRYPGMFILALVILLPFLTGDTTIWSWGWLSLKKEGCLLTTIIVTRFLCILTITLVLLGTSPFLTLLKSLNSFGLSPIISDMILLTYRYLEQFSDRLSTMKKALKLKGFNLHRYDNRQFKIIANLLGSLLVRSYDDSQLVYKAMKLRGYGQYPTLVRKTSEQINSSHWWASVGCIILGVSLVIGQEFL